MRAHVHKTTYGPLIDTALYVMLLMRANPLLGQVRVDWALEISTVLGHKMALALMAGCHLTGPKKVLVSRAQPPPICPRNGDSLIKSITYVVV